MRRLWRWLTEVSLGGVLLLMGRWTMRLSHPAEDVETVRQWGWRAEEWARDKWTILWRAFGPVTTDMRASWERLRERYRGGSYGLEGT